MNGQDTTLTNHGNSIQMRIIEKEGKKFIELIPGQIIIQNEQDTVDVIGMCGVNRTNLVMLYNNNLTDDFFNLKTCIAGNILQKFVQYRVKVAAILSPEKMKGRFKEMVTEAHSGSDFRVFNDRQKAEEWLLKVYKWPVG